MLYDEKMIEERAILDIAGRMCIAARTAPKTRGIDTIFTLVLTGEEKAALASKMDEIAGRDGSEDFFARDAGCVRKADAVVLIGTEKRFGGMNPCGFCGFDNCAECGEAGGRCFFDGINLGIALGSAVSIAADCRVDSRIFYSAGVAAGEMGYIEGNDITWQGIPIAAYGKNIFFDRHRERYIRPRVSLGD